MFTDRDMLRLNATSQFNNMELRIDVAQQYAYADGRWAIEESQYQPVSLDLRLGDLSDQDGLSICASGWADGDRYQILPGDFLLGNTIEVLRLGRRVWGKVEGKSTRARQGLLVECAGVVDPGFHGTITLELANLGRKPVDLWRGMRIAQVMFGWTNSDPFHIYGDPELGNHYQGQSAPTPARVG